MLRFLVLLISVFAYVNDAYAYRSDFVKEISFNKSIERAMLSVVNIYVDKNSIKNTKNLTTGQNKDKTVGSGVILSDSGLIVTNGHTVEGATSIEIVTANDQSYKANIVSVDPSLDLAFLKINVPNGQGIKVAKLADSDSLKIGDVVFSIGNPFGIGQSASMGIISGLGRMNVGADNKQYLIQTDAAINPGSSGGALVNVDGEIVGINSAIFSETTSFSGIGFAVPVNVVRLALESLNSSTKSNTKIDQPRKVWFGANVEKITENTRKSLLLKSLKGAYVTNVISGTPAYSAGIKPGDVIVKVHTFPVVNPSSLVAVKSVLPIGRQVSVKVIRNGQLIDLSMTSKSVAARSSSTKFIIKGNNILSGTVVENLSEELSYMLGVPITSSGLAVVKVSEKAKDLNLRINDVITSINGKPVNGIDSVKEIMEKSSPSKGWKIQVLRSGREISLFAI